MTDAKLVLPETSRTAWLTAFGVTMGLWTAIAVVILVPVNAIPRVAAALLAGVIVAIGFRARPREAAIVYRLWTRGTRLYARAARGALMVLCHAVISIAGLAGSSLVLRRPAPQQSMWHTRETLPAAAYRSQFDAPSHVSARRPWRAVTEWTLRSGNAWVVALIPFLVLASIVDADDDQPYPTGIYTLF